MKDGISGPCKLQKNSAIKIASRTEESPSQRGIDMASSYDDIKETWRDDWTDEKRSEFLKLFEEFVSTYLSKPDSEYHLNYYISNNREQARNNFESIKQLADREKDVENRKKVIEDPVLLKLLPYSDNQSNRERGYWISVAPTFTTDVRIKYGASGWVTDGWPEVAEQILDFVIRCDEHPDQLSAACEDFSASPYSKGFKAGTLSPILNALRPDHFIVFNKKTRMVLNYFTNQTYTQSLLDYPKANRNAFTLIQDLAGDMQRLSNKDMLAVDLFDMFSHWLVAIRKYPPVVGVSVPDDTKEDQQCIVPPTTEEAPAGTDHTRIQYLLLTLGSEMGLNVWVARNDRSKVWQGKPLGSLPNIVEELPKQFDDATQRTIELIDVLWLKGNSIISAFEIECTTSIFSGLLRMSDLLALQPNLAIKFYLVAPAERRDKVKLEIMRPTFQFISQKPLKDVCGYLSLEGLMEKIEGIKKLGLPYSSLNPNFLSDIAEYFGEDMD